MTAPMSANEIRNTLLRAADQRRIEQTARPFVQLWDKNFENPRPIWGEIETSFDDIMNDTGEGMLKLFANHKETAWLIREIDEAEDVHITVETPGRRWSGKVSTISYESGEGFDYVTLTFMSEYEHVKKIICYSNPLLPAEFQWPKIWMWAGASISGIKTLIFFNLLRRFGPLWALPENIFSAESWRLNLNPANWPIVVKPVDNFFTDTSMWTVMTTRFGNLHDVIAPTMKDAGLQLTWTRWLPGDPQPAPNHFTLTRATLVLDVVDKSGVRGPSGTLFDGLAKLGSAIASDGITELVTQYEWGSPPPQYSQPGFLGTVSEYPWVSFRNGQRTGLTGITNWKMTVHKPLAGAVVTGGKSPSWVNAGIKLLLNGVLGYIGMLFGNPALGLGIFDEQVEDVILAFHRVAHNSRQSKMGRAQYGEHWENTGGTGFSVSALQAIRVGLWKTRAYTSYEVSVRNGAPYWIGRHCDLGDRVSAEVGDLQSKMGRLYVDQIHGVKLSWGREQDTRYDLTIGNGDAEGPPGAVLDRQLEQVRTLIQSLGVDS